MKVAICSSMVFSEKMLEVKNELEKLGHEVLVPKFIGAYTNKPEKEKEALVLFYKN